MLDTVVLHVIKINDDDRAKYCAISDANLLRIPIPHDAPRCSDAKCRPTNVDHRNDLYKFYDNITGSMSKASDAIFDNNCVVLTGVMTHIPYMGGMNM